MVLDFMWCDGFDQYGGGGAMNQVYQQVPEMANGGARTGNWYCGFFDNVGLGLTLASQPGNICVGAGINAMSGGSNDTCMNIEYTGVEINLGFTGTQQLQISLNRGPVATSNPGAIVINAWQWWELQVLNIGTKLIINGRVNGVLVVSYEDDAFGAGKVASGFNASKRNGFLSNFGLDDLVIVAGDEFPGDRRCYYLPVAADTAQADWAITGAASGHAALSNIPANDAQFISANAVGQKSNFVIADMPPGTFDSMLGLMIYTRMQKSDAGLGNAQAGFIVGAGQNNGSEQVLNAAWTGHMDPLQNNPVTGLPYTIAEMAGAVLTIERTV